MVEHLVATSKPGILVPKSIEAVRTRCDDFRDIMPIECLNVFLRECFEQELVADSSCEIAGAFLLSSQNGKADTRLHEKLCQRARFLLTVLLQGPG